MQIAEVARSTPIESEHGRRAERVAAHRYVVSVQGALGPKVLDGNGLTGQVAVAFSLTADGNLAGVRVVRSSGHGELDSKALALVSGGRFPTSPEGGAHNHVSVFTFR